MAIPDVDDSRAVWDAILARALEGDAEAARLALQVGLIVPPDKLRDELADEGDEAPSGPIMSRIA